ncbi:general secretion pathway protein K [Desulfosarcina sp. BuS5]|uniref:general secretion pathway protein GspK n=1 Tax=Desulfosarcina sp. BuS5 TaxID=933262 RepID=UPI00047F88ED|nr:helix-hairpin-helix domain-containing protein [Desulfosarcina sp. BuS5]WDN90301.1 general secretion pathway protein K [Desulfosarcina sp. BuS5]
MTEFKILNNKNGIALFVVLWLVALLAVIVGEFCHAMRTEINITRNFKESAESYYIALAGINRAVAELLIRKHSRPEVLPPEEESDETNETEWRVGADIAPVDFGTGAYKVTITNESGKININKAAKSMLMMLLNTFDIDENEKDVITDSILDWRDKDNLHHLNGAEDDYYQSLDNPYECKDADFDSVEELLLVKGITKAIFYGGLESMVTIYSETGKININAASEKMLLSIPGMTGPAAKEIIKYRGEQKIKSIAELNDIIDPDIYLSIKSYIALNLSPFYTIESFGGIAGSSIKEGIGALIKIDAASDKGYRIIRWTDFVEDQFVF